MQAKMSRTGRKRKSIVPGTEFGALTVIAAGPAHFNYPSTSFCQCKCGKTAIVSNSELNGGKTHCSRYCPLSIAIRKEAARSRHPVRLDRIAKIVEMRKNKATLMMIGNAFGITRERVRQILKKAGVVGPLDFSEERKALSTKIDAMVVAGATHKEVARKLGICEKKVADLKSVTQAQLLDIKYRNMAGYKFPNTRLTFVGRCDDFSKTRRCVFRCDCGKIHKALIANVLAASRHEYRGSRSCGCLDQEYRQAASVGFGYDVKNHKVRYCPVAPDGELCDVAQ